jgi:hypothetical protein
MPLVWILFLGIVVVLAFTALSWLAGRLLGHHQPWPRALLAALLGSAIGNAFVTAVSSPPFAWPPTAPPSYPLLRVLTALLATMGVSVLLEVLAHRDTASPGRIRCKVQSYLAVIRLLAKVREMASPALVVALLQSVRKRFATVRRRQITESGQEP